jgi:hypothetical protein
MSVLAALVLVLVLPAVAGAVALSGPVPGAKAVGGEGTARVARPDLLVARGIACGVAVWFLGSGLLTRTVGLTATSAWVWDACAAALSAVVLLLPRNRARLRAVLGPTGRRVAEVGVLSALVFLPLGRAIVHTSWSPLGSTPWYYYGLARQVADVGSIPATSLEFGTSTSFLNDYHLFTTGTAMLLVQHPGGPIAVITTITLLSVLFLGLGSVALTSALGARRSTALIAVPIVIAAGIAPLRLAAYRPEGFALGLALVLVALGIDWLRERDPRSLVAAGLLAATLSQVHGIAALCAGVMITAAALVSWAGGERREQLRRIAIAVVTLAAGVVVAALVFHEASGTVHAGGLVDRGGLADPTWEFFRAARGDPSSTPPANLAMMEQSVRQLYSWQKWWMIPTLLLACYGLWRHRAEAAVRRAVAFALLSLLGILLVASVFMLGWQGYVPRRTGASRLVAEASLLGPPLLAIGLGCAVSSVRAWLGRQRLATYRWLGDIVVLAVVAVCGWTSLSDVAAYDDGMAPSRAQLAVWRSLPLTRSDVVLANGYTEGFIPDLTGAQGLLDGRAPYTFDAQLKRANGLLRGARAFYGDPAGHWDFLAQNHITWVVVGVPGTWSLGTNNVWDVPDATRDLARCAGLQRVTGDPTLSVFRVVDSSAQGCAP